MEANRLTIDPLQIKKKEAKAAKEAERTDTKKNLEKYATKQINEVSLSNSTNEQVQSVIEANKKRSAIIKSCLKEGIDYGIIPYTKNKTLYQSGADTLALTFGLKVELKLIEKDLIFEQKYIDYKYEATAYHNEKPLQKAFASCNSLEQKFHSHFEKFNAKDGTWQPIPGKSVFDIKNTIDQIAQKRAFVRVIRKTLGITGQFTQDEEDKQYASKDDKLAIYQDLYFKYENLDFLPEFKNKKEKRNFIKDKILKAIIVEKNIPTNIYKWDNNHLEIIKKELENQKKWEEVLKNATEKS